MMKKHSTGSRKSVGRRINLQNATAITKSSRNLFEPEEILSKIIQRPGIKFILFIAGILYVSAVSNENMKKDHDAVNESWGYRHCW